MTESSSGLLENMLPRLGFSPRTFSEVVLVLRASGEAHVQPLGVKLKGGVLWARVFESTRLHKLVRPGLRGSLNITHDPRAFFEPVMYGRLYSLELCDSVLGPYLASCDAAVFVEVARVVRERYFSSVFFRPLGIFIGREHPTAFNRAFPALIEALVHLTRIRHYARSGDVGRVEALAERVRSCVETLRHATEDRLYLDMASEVMAEAERWAYLAREIASLPEKGVYTLVIRLGGRMRLRVGSLGAIELEEGYHLYTGSAIGRGALGLRKRIMRHLSRPKKAFWHIDYLLNERGASVAAVVAAGSERRMECEVNRALMEELGAAPSSPGFGSSDCRSGCPAHLLYAGPSSPVDAVERVYRRLGLKPVLVEVGERRSRD